MIRTLAQGDDRGGSSIVDKMASVMVEDTTTAGMVTTTPRIAAEILTKVGEAAQRLD